MEKPKRTSITVTVRNGDNFRATRPGKTWLGEGMTFNRVRAAFPKNPTPPYKVTYRLDPKGKYRVDDSCLFLAHSGEYLYEGSVDDAMGFFACFLPDEWDGLRVSRKAKAIR